MRPQSRNALIAAPWDRARERIVSTLILEVYEFLKMIRIDVESGDIEIEADVVAKGLKRDVASLREDMRSGKVTCLYERGIDEDEGRVRITFFSDTGQYRLVVDEKGQIVQRSLINLGNAPLRKAPLPASRG